ncbi:YceI family protein [Gillisia sp. M10.2A]|uniref:YceI family protein n=1 Tax=Gillisia lutea TaxID=2909668 RepID=A0ABS9EEJ8_9FLAO|nr:YceI family protein [Gillisia lutea]MCF4100200.1 YceI family protein [Gillisia lutea]
MKTTKYLLLLFTSLLTLVSVQQAHAQSFNLSNSDSNMEIEGTSNLHDWEIKANDFQGKLAVEMAEGKIIKINQLDFKVTAESLKSGKSGMDKNTYKALDTDHYKNIVFTLERVNKIDFSSTDKCKISCSGFLTITNTKQPVDLILDATIKGEKIVLSGNKSLKMSNFKIDPPTALFGTITTGDLINVKFKTVFTK